jgi:hypothetical protein
VRSWLAELRDRVFGVTFASAMTRSAYSRSEILPTSVFAPEVKIETLWDGVLLAIVLGIYAVVVTVVGVLVARLELGWLAVYAVASLGILAALSFVEAVRRWAIGIIQLLPMRSSASRWTRGRLPGSVLTLRSSGPRLASRSSTPRVHGADVTPRCFVACACAPDVGGIP